MVCYFQRSCQNARATENLFGLYGPGIGLLCTLLSKWLKGGKISQVSQSSHLREARFHNLYMTVSNGSTPMRVLLWTEKKTTSHLWLLLLFRAFLFVAVVSNDCILH